MVKNSHGVSPNNNPKRTRKTKKRIAANMARKYGTPTKAK